MIDSADRKRSRDVFEHEQSDNVITPQHKTNSPKANHDVDDAGAWQTIEPRSKRRKAQKAERNYPAISHSSHARLQSFVKIGDLQNLVLYLLADGSSPQWCSVRHHHAVKKVVVLMVPGLEADMFTGKIPLVLVGQDRRDDDEDETVEENESAKEISGSDPNKSVAAGQENGSSSTEAIPRRKTNISPDDYYPVKLITERIPDPVRPISRIFDHIWPIKTPGEDRHAKMHSPLAAMLISPIAKTKEEKKSKGPQFPPEGRNWKDQSTPVTSLLASVQDLVDDGYVLHPSHFEKTPREKDEVARRENNKTTASDGWIDLPIASLVTAEPFRVSAASEASNSAGRKVLAMDCEMCLTSERNAVSKKFSLTRISIVDWDGKTVLDEFVKPAEAITDYLTPYSGITPDALQDVTTSLADIQAKLAEILTHDAILIGHSLNSDLNALRITFPYIIDTAMLYPHPRGPPLKSSLKWLSQKYLLREIQRGHGSTGHDSIEDARACLDLVKQKCEKGLTWGTSEASGESIFKRIGRAAKHKQQSSSGVRVDEGYRTSAVVDWGDPVRGYGSSATLCIGAESDADVVQGIRLAVNGSAKPTDDNSDGAITSNDSEKAPYGHLNVPSDGCDFVWARFRELEAFRGWWSRSKTVDSDQLRSTTNEASASSTLADVTLQAMQRVVEVYDCLPAYTALVVYSGSGDPRELQKMQEMQRRFKEEYRIKKWDELSVKWTDTEEQELKAACEKARRGCGFITVK